MSLSLDQVHSQFLTDPQGDRTSVLLPPAEYETLLEELEDLRDALKPQGEPSIPRETLQRDVGSE